MKPRVSDHALLRFMERAGGMPVETVRHALAASLERAFTAAEAMGGGEFSIAADGFVFVVRGGQVVTVLDDSVGARKRGAHGQGV